VQAIAPILQQPDYHHRLKRKSANMLW